MPRAAHPADAPPERTKRCSACRGPLAWDAVGCHHCGAGRPAPAAPPPVPAPRPRFLPSARVSLAILGVLALAAGGLVWKRHVERVSARDASLVERQADLAGQIDTLSAQRVESEAQAQQWTQLARSFQAAQAWAQADEAQAKADQHFKAAQDVQASLAPLEEALRAVRLALRRAP